MKAALVNLVFNETTLLLAHIIKNLRENPFQGVVSHFTTLRPLGILNRLVSVVADINCSAIKMAGILCSIDVASTEFLHIRLCAQHAGSDNLMQRNAFGIKGVEECTSDVLKQYSRTRYEIRAA